MFVNAAESVVFPGTPSFYHPLLFTTGSRRILFDAHSPNRVLCRYCVYRTDVKVESGMVEGGHWQRLNPRPSYTCFVNRTAACLRQIYALRIMSSILNR